MKNKIIGVKLKKIKYEKRGVDLNTQNLSIWFISSEQFHMYRKSSYSMRGYYSNFSFAWTKKQGPTSA